MIKVNGKEVNVEHFLDGTQRLLSTPLPLPGQTDIVFEWRYQSDEELVTLMYLTHHCRENGYVGKYILRMPFIPNARMDRTHGVSEVFTLKWFCQVINSLHFDQVVVLDPHSNVSSALLDRVVVRFPVEIVENIIKSIGDENIVFYYPDFGAYKKYSALFKESPYCYGKKKRDWQTGKLLALEVENELNIDLAGKTILIIDDIISYGGTMHYGAKRLKELGVGKIYAYATHTEMSVLNKEKGTLLRSLEDGTIEKLFTTDSLFNGTHEKIEIFKLND